MNDGLRGALVKVGTFVATVVLLVLFVFAMFRAVGLPVSAGWIGRTLTGQLGVSKFDGEPVLQLILERMPASLELVVGSIVIALVCGLLVGAVVRRSPQGVRRTVEFVGLALKSVPAFWLVLFAQMWVATHMHVDVAGLAGTDRFDLGDRLVHLVLPATLLALVLIPAVVEWAVARPRPAPLVAILARRLPTVFAIGFLVEVLFAWPGEGRLFFHSGLLSVLGVLLVYSVFAIGARTVVASDV